MAARSSDGGSVQRVAVTIDGRKLSLSNLEKVMFPETGFTKAQVIDYYARVAVAMIPHTEGRCMTMRRWPDGVDGQSFFNKRCPDHRPDWLATSDGPGDRNGTIGYCRIDEPAALVWTANMASIELHAPMAKAVDIEAPTMVVFDLDPGEGVGITECAQVAMLITEVLAAVGLEAVAKTSGSKGLQVYVPLNTPHTHGQASDFARAVGQLLTKQHPKKVLVDMSKKLRAGKVFIDWSQNSRHKTTVAAYSLRAQSRPVVSTPLNWDEVSDGADGASLSFTSDEVIQRVAKIGDIFAPAANLRQELPVGG